MNRLGVFALVLTLVATLGVSPLAAAQVTLTGGVTNAIPVVTSVTVTSSFNPTSGTTTSVPISTVVTDANGCNDLTTGTGAVTASILKPDGSTVHIAATALTYASCAASGAGAGIAATFTGTLLMQYYDAAATAGSTYKVKIAVTDRVSATADNLLSLSTFSYTALVALAAPSATSFAASAAPGVATAALAVAIVNEGNSQIDTQVSGTALTLSSPSATIPVGSISYSLSSSMTSPAALSSSATTITAFDLAAGASSAKNLYVQLTVPAASATQYTPSGSYVGTVTVTAVSG